MYRYNFELIREYLPTVIQDMGSITTKAVWGKLAEYEMLGTQDGFVRSFYIEFVMDADGIWRINFF
jgi:hypothetical protein